MLKKYKIEQIPKGKRSHKALGGKPVWGFLFYLSWQVLNVLDGYSRDYLCYEVYTSIREYAVYWK